MLLTHKTKLLFKILVKIISVIFIFLGVAAVLTFVSVRSLQNFQFASASNSAQIANLLLQPAQLLTFHQLQVIEAWSNGLRIIQLTPNLNQDLQNTINSFTPAYNLELSQETKANQLISTNNVNDLMQLNSYYQQFFNHFQKSWLLQKLSTQTQQQQLLSAQKNLTQFTTVINHLAQDQHHIVLLLNNSDELRSGGGFTGSLATMTLNHGALTEPVFYDIYDLSNQITHTLSAPSGVQQYLSAGKGLALTDANWAADFSQASTDILALLAQTNLPSTDLLISVNLNLIKELLTVTGPVYLPDAVGNQPENQTVTAENVTQLARQQRLQFFAGDKQKKQFLQQLYSVLKLELVKLDQQQFQQLGLMLAQAKNSKDLMAYSTNAEIQAILVQAQLAGTLNFTTDYFLYLIESNVGINKANQAIQRQVELHFQPHQIIIQTEFQNLNQPLTEAEIALIENNPDLLQATHLGYVNYQRLVTNLPINKVSLKCGDEQLKLEEDGIIPIWQGQATQLGFLITLPEQTNKNCSYLITPEQALNSQQTWTIFRQPGLPATTYYINYFDQFSEQQLDQNLSF